MNFTELFDKSGSFLMLGHCEKELSDLIAAKWKGIVVAPQGTWGKRSLSDDEYYSDVTYIEALLSTDGHFTRLMQGYWIKPLSIEEIFQKYGDSRFDLIIIKVEMLTRSLWSHRSIQDHLPRVYAIEEDGHNEGVITVAADRGYHQVFARDGWLIMKHRRAGEAEILTEAEKGLQ